MKKLNRNEIIAVFAGLSVLAYLLFSSELMNIFSSDSLASNNNQMQTGVSAQDIVVGPGALAETGNIVTAHYVGELLNGRVFDSSRDRNTPIQFRLGVGQVIRGWDEGLVGMRVGGKRILTISPEYGYGAQAIGAIPANSTLIFEVELLDVEKPQ